MLTIVVVATDEDHGSDAGVNHRALRPGMPRQHGARTSLRVGMLGQQMRTHGDQGHGMSMTVCGYDVVPRIER